MFELRTEPFERSPMEDTLRHPAAGGFVTFEGWVRNENDGRQVVALEYEAYEGVAVEEGRKILREAAAEFDTLNVACIHRVGRLRIGDLAVWVGVSAAHRNEAFAACRYIIDELKTRLPIWKKEFYVDGESAWINCQTESHAHDRSAS